MEKAASFQSLISTLEDPRQQTKVLHPLDEILLLCLCEVVSGCESFVDIVEYGAEKLKFLRRLADFEHGVLTNEINDLSNEKTRCLLASSINLFYSFATHSITA